MRNRNSDNKSFFLQVSRSLLKTSNVLFITAIILLVIGVNQLQPHGDVQRLYENGTYEQRIYMREGQKLDIGLVVVEVGNQNFNVERYYDKAILDIKLYFTGNGDIAELMYEGQSAAWSRNYVATAGYYLLVVENLVDEPVSFISGYASATIAGVMSIVAGSIFLSFAAAIASITISLIVVGAIMYVLFMPLREIAKYDRERNQRFYREQTAQ